MARQVVVNSTWTRAHLERLGVTDRVLLVYPPCEVSKTTSAAPRERLIVSLAQFRPEKNHQLQLQSLAALFEMDPSLQSTVTLVLVGGCRNSADQMRVEQLRELAKKLGIAPNVQFEVDAGQTRVQHLLATGLIGIHSMTDEHFGMAIVESMGAGLVMVAHRSGGPLADIVGEGRGFLAQTANEYAQAMQNILAMDDSALHQIRVNARKWVLDHFDARLFERAMLKAYPQML